VFSTAKSFPPSITFASNDREKKFHKIYDTYLKSFHSHKISLFFPHNLYCPLNNVTLLLKSINSLPLKLKNTTQGEVDGITLLIVLIETCGRTFCVAREY